MISLKPRDYQSSIVETAKNNNTLVVLPTGLGKTLIALLLTIHQQKKHPGSKALILAPTKPLIEQHFNTFKSELPELFADLQLFTGSVQAQNRKKIFQTADIIFSTPQCIANDLSNHLYTLHDISLLIIDEAHRCLKNYDYTKVANTYKQQAENQRILGLTASPGHDSSKIQEICKHLNIEEIEIRSRDSPDVKPYLQTLEFEKVEVPFPKEFIEIKVLLKKIFDTKVNQLISRHLLFGPANKISLLQLQKKLASKIGSRDFNAMIGMSLTAQTIKISHAIELLETQTLSGLNEYLKNLQKQAKNKQSKGVQTLVKTPEFNAAVISLQNLLTKEMEHPKVEELAVIIESEIEENPKAKTMVFCQFRETALTIAKRLNKIPNINAQIFIGQTKKSNSLGKMSGLSQKEQKQVVEDFREGKINTLIATSVHPDEYIIVKKNKEVKIYKIGEFVNKFIKNGKNKSQTKKIEDYETLSSDGKKVYFTPITHVHKHPSKNNCLNIKLSSGLDSLITKDHSLFSFNKNNNFVPTMPENNKFVSLAFKCPNPENNQKIDILKKLSKNRNIFGSLERLSQSKIRELKTDYQVFSALEKKRQSISDLTKSTKRNYSTIHRCLKKSLNEKLISQKRLKKNWKNISMLTNHGKEYSKFLKWFFNNVNYYKGKYRFLLKNTEENNPEFNKFYEQKLNVNYGKTNFPRFLEINKYTARFLGFYVSEGSTRKTKFTSDVFLAARVKKMQKRMKKSIEKGLNLKTRTNRRGIAIDSQIAYYLIKDIFKAGIGSYNKEVPEIIFTSPSKIKWEFIKAYTQGDGHIAKDKIVLTTVSRKLVTGLILLFRMLGVEKITLYRQKNIYRINIHESLPFAKINEKNEKWRRKSYFSLVPTAINSEKEFNKFKNYYKNKEQPSQKSRKMGKWDEDVCFDYIKNIEKLKKQPEYVYDLSVKKTENFLGGTGLLCLHNSIGEEGLDIPEVSAVIFYEPIPSAVRKIQRAGRTARLAPGKLIILLTKDTRDVAFHYASQAREKKMYKTLETIKKDLNKKTLDSYK